MVVQRQGLVEPGGRGERSLIPDEGDLTDELVMGAETYGELLPGSTCVKKPRYSTIALPLTLV